MRDVGEGALSVLRVRALGIGLRDLVELPLNKAARTQVWKQGAAFL